MEDCGVKDLIAKQYAVKHHHLVLVSFDVSRRLASRDT